MNRIWYLNAHFTHSERFSVIIWAVLVLNAVFVVVFAVVLVVAIGIFKPRLHYPTVSFFCFILFLAFIVRFLLLDFLCVLADVVADGLVILAMSGRGRTMLVSGLGLVLKSQGRVTIFESQRCSSWGVATRYMRPPGSVGEDFVK